MDRDAGAKLSARTNRELKILQDQQAVAKLVMQYRVERAAKRMGIVGAIMIVLITIAGVVSIFRPDHFYGP